MSKQSILMVCALVLVACGGSRPVVGSDSGGGTDAGTTPGTDSGPRADSGGGGHDSGPTSSDPCSGAAETSAANAGCNGGFSSTGPMTCTGDAAGGAGTCPSGVCSGAEGAMGFCFLSCTNGGTYVSTGGCATGSRCFMLDMDICFFDCDATHACPTGMMCDDEGSCVPM
jgi:hypothetical protein